MCLAPCKKWNYPSPFGLNRSEDTNVGKALCCPHPVTPATCQAGIVVNTKYVELLRRVCPTAYSYSYDDLAGLHNCPNPTNFIVKVC